MSASDDTALRRDLTSDQRSASLRLTIDPGFVNARRIGTVIGASGRAALDAVMKGLPSLPDWRHRTRVDHIYKDFLLEFCRVIEAPTLLELLAEGKGTIFCATVELEPAPDVYDVDRTTSRVAVAGQQEMAVTLAYGTEHIHASTTRMELHEGGPMAVVALFRHRVGKELVFEPILMGAPWLEDGEEAATFPGVEFHSFDYFETFPEDIDQLALVREVPLPDSAEPMRSIKENAFKQCLAEILGDEVKADWGGERSDHYTAHVTLRGRPITAAFLLKGPGSGFRSMTLNHLGAKNDQIFRLAQEPAGLLVVQHCHDIGPEVRATLRAFAVQPGSPRRYCLVDGRESLRLLIAYDKLGRALELSSDE